MLLYFQIAVKMRNCIYIIHVFGTLNIDIIWNSVFGLFSCLYITADQFDDEPRTIIVDWPSFWNRITVLVIKKFADFDFFQFSVIFWNVQLMFIVGMQHVGESWKKSSGASTAYHLKMVFNIKSCTKHI